MFIGTPPFGIENTSDRCDYRSDSPFALKTGAEIWLLEHMLEFHRRENKAPWWEHFRLRDLTDEELLVERSALGSRV